MYPRKFYFVSEIHVHVSSFVQNGKIENWYVSSSLSSEKMPQVIRLSRSLRCLGDPGAWMTLFVNRAVQILLYNA